MVQLFLIGLGMITLVIATLARNEGLKFFCFGFGFTTIFINTLILLFTGV